MSSIFDVAKRAGVSVTTVSRVINRSSHPVNPKTRERVLAAARELDFKPSALARALASDQTHIIGVIVGDASDPYFATVVRGISDAARDAGYLTILCNSDRVPDVELNFVQILRDYRADGVIFAGGGLTDSDYLRQMEELLVWFRTHDVPVVALGHHLFKVPQVSYDNKRATCDMMEYLLGLGHRRIGFIAGPEGLTTSIARTEGYRQALEDAGLPFDPALVVESDFTQGGGQQAAERLLASEPSITAIFAANDCMAIGCLVALKRLGIEVPRQVSVVGFDDIAATQYVFPPLTTVRIPMYDLGISGLQQLLSAMRSDVTIEPLRLLPYELVIRLSAGPSLA
jgi:LacI family transcriptional regulator